MRVTRRHAVRSGLSAATLGLAGCLGSSSTDDRTGATGTPTERRSRTGDAETVGADTDTPPLAETPRYLGHDIETVRENVVSGGVSKDGIPAIDDPQFEDPKGVDLDDGAPVFGLVRDGVAKAYPQYVLVWHEIVNDVVGGEPVAVTYCPLTGTVQGFERGDVEFGVSGRLVNSNLVMYDRATDSWWPQVLATAVDGPLEGNSLREFRVVWTTWSDWREAYPDTRVLTEETGHVRRYGSDPYGGYNPREGYYASGDAMFEALAEDDRAGPKDVVVGTRTTDGAIAFEKSALLDDRVLSGTIGGVEYVAVAGSELRAGYVYANTEGADVTAENPGYRIEGQTYAADELPLDRSLAFDAMWFAWAGFYPDTAYVD